MTTSISSDKSNKTPNWLRQKIQLLIKNDKLQDLRTGELINNLPGNIIDHWGSCGDIFYTEPYGTQEECEPDAKTIAKLLECQYRFVNSKHNPPMTCRIEFYV